MIGFKFVFPKDYPQDAPLAFLDGAEDPEVIEMVDYLDKGNKIMFQYLIDWAKEPNVKS